MKEQELHAELPMGSISLNQPHVIGILVGLMLTLLLVALDQTILTAAAPRIVSDLNGFERYAWISTAYMLTSTVTVPIFGKLSDIYGRRRFFLPGISLFVLASVLCGLAGLLPLPLDGMNQLILFRGLQGLAGGIMTSLIFIIIGDLFPPAIRGKYQGLFGAVWLLASLVGPTLGGWLSESFSWRWIFYINIPVGIAAVLIFLTIFPSLKPSGEKKAIDYAGIITLSVGLVALMLALTWIPGGRWTSPNVLIALLVALCMLALFFFAEKRATEPVLPLSLFRNSIIVVSAFSIIFSSVGAYGIILYLPLFMQQVMGISATESGALLTPALVILIVGNVAGGMLVSLLGRYKWITFAGVVFMAIGALLLSLTTDVITPLMLVVCLMLIAAGLGITTPLYTIISQNATSHDQLGTVTAFTQFIRQIGVILGTAIAGATINQLYGAEFNRTIPTGVSPSLLAPFKEPLQLTHQLPRLQQQFAGQAGGPHLLEVLLKDANSALMLAMNRTFLICGAVLVVVVAANFFLKEIPLRTSNAKAKKPESQALDTSQTVA